MGAKMYSCKLLTAVLVG